MGVPAFFRWLSRKYPSVIIECTENKNYDDNGQRILEDPSLPNPNGVEFDNLYLDMNGIIHPCTHPEDKPAPKNEDEMMVAIFECIDRIFNIVRPRKVLYMAIDGVAPRAKMNQQRSRRFRAAKETAEKQIEIKKIREELLAKGCILPPEKPKGEHFDSNCITPGTPFMERLSLCLHYYIHDRLNNNPGWKNIKIILSDANDPGEGEHKIMDYIRKQRGQPDHDPNTQHVLCGADADLIMLGLATHEPNFTIIREEFLPNKPKPCDVCAQFGHEAANCEGLNAGAVNSSGKPSEEIGGQEVNFIFVRLSVLREYLRRELAMPNLPFPYDFERVIDDWVFMCFFVGNDFLPHLPSLEIRENAIDRLVALYKKCVYKTGGFLTDSGNVTLNRVQIILTDLGLVEDQIFRERQKREERFKAMEKAKRRRMENEGPPNMSNMLNSQFSPTPLGRGINPGAIQGPRQEAARFRIMGMHTQASADGSNSRAGLESLIRPESGEEGKGKKRKSNASEVDGETEGDEDYQANDEVRLWEVGFKDRYYESKFDVPATNQAFRYSVALQYVRGLCWVLKYYYQGCASWKWYFPYHYAPFASDFVNIEGLSTEFERGTIPFNPLEQLMGVFPAASGSHVPEPWAKLMSDPSSPIIDFYPEDFKIDLNGKKFAWQGVALLPFVDEKRLFKALKPLYKLLTPAEIKRNQRGDSRLYVGPANPGYKFLKTLYKNKVDKAQEIPISIQGMRGIILISNDCVPKSGTLHSPIPGLPDIEENEVVTVRYKNPYYPEGYKFPAIRLKNAVDPEKVLAPGRRDADYKPVIGFNRNLPSASLDNSGHRMINHYTGNRSNQQEQSRSYGNVPPPAPQFRILSRNVNVNALERLMPSFPQTQLNGRLSQLVNAFGKLTCELDRGNAWEQGRNRMNQDNRDNGNSRFNQNNNNNWTPRNQFPSQGGERGFRPPNRHNDGNQGNAGGYRQQSSQQGGNFHPQNRQNNNNNNNMGGGFRHQSGGPGGGGGGGGGSGHWVSGNMQPNMNNRNQSQRQPQQPGTNRGGFNQRFNQFGNSGGGGGGGGGGRYRN